MRIGRHRYRVELDPALTTYGRVFYSMHTMLIKPRAEKKMRESMWHETTHAILNEMGHSLRNNERFVTEFSRLLSRAIDSARFE